MSENAAAAESEKKNTNSKDTAAANATTGAETDEFGLSSKKIPAVEEDAENTGADGSVETKNEVAGESVETHNTMQEKGDTAPGKEATMADHESEGEDDFEDAPSTPAPVPADGQEAAVVVKEDAVPAADIDTTTENTAAPEALEESKAQDATPDESENIKTEPPVADDPSRQAKRATGNAISEWSHQQLATTDANQDGADDAEWQTMPAYAPYDMYDDDNRLIAREAHDSDVEDDPMALGGAGKGYTRVQLDEDAQSATSMDENTQYLFKDVNGGTGAGFDDGDQRDALSQMQATKDLLTEGQRIAYVGMTRLTLSSMVKFMENLPQTKQSKKMTSMSAEATKMWSQKMMVRLYAHMDISTAEQVMIEQLADHGVVPSDLTPTLMQNAGVKNPMAEQTPSTTSLASPRPGSVMSGGKSPRASISSRKDDEETATPPPAYREHDGEDLPEVRTPSQLPTTKNLDIDLRWTVLCDLFLTLIADSVYDARSRVLLEQVGEHMGVSWLEICRFEKRVTDALEMQQAAEKENWNEDEHKENRRKMALKKRYMMMGLATVGGSLVIGLSAGLLAPVIGAGLAAGFTTIGVAGTSGFLAGAGGAAIITTGAAASGGVVGIRAANRRTGAVKTFEYRPLHNNKRVNLIVTVSGWMTGKVDDVRLPYSTVDPIMGDIYSVLWEPEMLTSMGDTINILATEALTQGLQQVLGSTVLIGLMAALQLPIVLTKLAYLIDNPWTVSCDRATSAGLILADSLIDRNLGTRPITLVGYSLGSRVIFSCLQELAKKGAYGLVQNVYLFGSPIVARKDEYLKARAVVAGRFVSGYAKTDWILGYLFRLTNGGLSRVAGLAPVEDIPGLENVDVSELVPGHMSYRAAMPRLLRQVGWTVESDEFTEIEDPDPENHNKRQRELINEIEEARKEFEKKEKEGKGGGSGGAFGWLKRSKKGAVEKKEWEVYQENKEGVTKYEDGLVRNGDTAGGFSSNGVLFDIDAIKKELAGENMEVRELPSTLPPMKVDMSPSLGSTGGSGSPRPGLVGAKTFAGETLHASPRMNGEGEVQLSFDTSFHDESPPVPPKDKERYTPSPSPSPGLPSVRVGDAARPELKSSTSLPPLGLGLNERVGGLNIEHNAWADDDEEEFGKEKEIEMTFA